MKHYSQKMVDTDRIAETANLASKSGWRLRDIIPATSTYVVLLFEQDVPDAAQTADDLQHALATVESMET